MKAKKCFLQDAFTIQFECDAELYHSMMAILNWTNRRLSEGDELTGDEILNIALEDFLEAYMHQLPKLLKRIGA